MTSVFNGATKQNANDIGYYINVGDLRGQIYAYNTTAGQATFSTALWHLSSPYSSLVAVAGGAILKDMGKTVVSSNRTFRKIQMVYGGATNQLSTNGVVWKAGTTPNEDYATGYIELGFDGTGAPAKVAHFGR